ncbi:MULTISPECIES: C40 family peptidase [Caballeronia]|uniref:Peptidase P60 n=1 Tax=Caballeronia cordobensis TaxID=1353886 RepID=A0A158IHD0_CABCO|nr:MULTISPECIES: C40 family peptidase [Caballeronia]AET89549.1 NLP/P60 protein [Burkholderia sp. YI23]BAO86814.1 NLP/P60 protein [Burkholderia sp. RPE67]MCE4541401.1 C40 family peptidase [Caballeronia sp. PC1]MCE4569555.1 C40 family peptidase [Caballeronia sp. CLC5]SAL55965.1 peptidase P60 [Caballeronia cordobensis]
MQPLTMTQTCARAAAGMLIGLLMTTASGAFADEVSSSSQNARNGIFSSSKSTDAASADAASNPGGAKSFLSGVASKAGDVVVGALNMIGVRYRWGGNTPDSGLDCSGFVRYVFQDTLGMTLPRRAEEMSRVGEKVTVADLKPGDLVFFNTMRRSFSHVGIYIGDNKFVHSPSTGSTIRVDDMEDGYWEKRFQGARRIDNAQVGDGSELRQRVSASIGGY